MKRLMRKATQEVDVNQPETMSDMQQLNELDEADVRHDRCPSCKNPNLEREDGFKQCPRCGSVYKVLDGNAYIVG